MREELYNCPLCDRRNFSARGLQGHRCTSPELLECNPFGLITGRPKLPADLITAIIEDDTTWVADLVAAIKAPKPGTLNR